METVARTLGTEAIMEEPRLLSTVADPIGRPVELECDHFSIRGYVAQQQKKDPKLCSLRIFCNQQQYDEHNSNSSPLLVAKYQRWNCSSCLARVKNSSHGTRSETVPMQQDGTNDDCSISIIRTLPYSAGSRRLFSCTQQSPQGNDADQSNVSKSVRECNSKCSSPSDNKAVTAVNVPATSAENNVPDTLFVEKSVPDTEDLQGSPNNLDVSENILNDVSMRITDLLDDPQMIQSKDGNVDCNESSVQEPISGHEGSKSSSGQKSNHACNKGPRRAAPKRNVGFDGKKKKSKSADLDDVSDLKFSKRKPKKTRLISKMFPPILLKRKVLSPTNSCDKNTENSTIKRSMLRKDDLRQVESEGTAERCLTKVSLGLQQNGSSLHKQNIPNNKKKQRLKMQTVIDDIPMDIVELLATNQHERQLRTDTDSTQPKIVAVDCEDGPTNSSTVLDSNFQKSLASESKQKSLQGRALSSSIEAANVLQQELYREESSQCHAASSMEIPNGHRSELQQNSLHIHALPITECTQEQQTDICRDEQVTIAYGASNDYATHQPVIAAVESQYTKEAVNQVPPTSAPSTVLTLEVCRPYDHIIAGHSGLYPKELVHARHLLRLVNSSTSQGFTNDYQTANRSQMELSSQYAQHNQYNALPSTSRGSHPTEKLQLTLQDLGRHQVEKILHRPLRPHPRVGVFGPLLQQDIANWSESCGHNLGFVTSAANPEHPLRRYSVSEPWAGGAGKAKAALDKLVRKDICQTNRNPADFTVISDENEYMINL